MVRVFEDSPCTAEHAGPDGHVPACPTFVGGRRLQGVDVLTAPDRVRTVMVRPPSAAHAPRDRIGALLGG